jgi:hypothetical protein
MAHSSAERILAAKGGEPVQGSGRRPGRLPRRGPLNEEEIEQKNTPPNMIVVEQWICFVLGFACMTCGILGICVRAGQYALSKHIGWLGSFYLPALRLTAVTCLGMGLMLIRRGWSHL